jgi:SAM-dependent methyltransferase
VSDRFTQGYWDDLYLSRPALWSGQPNRQLVTQVEGTDPGVALDAGSGEGADAIWLAARGWRVLAVDLSTVALDRGRKNAALAGSEVADRIEWLHRDIGRWQPPPDHFDLVSSQYIHFEPTSLRLYVSRMASAVAPGGVLLVVGHAVADQGMLPDTYFFTGADIAQELDATRWDVLTDDVVPRADADHHHRHEGNVELPVHSHDVVVRARRVRRRTP